MAGWKPPRLVQPQRGYRFSIDALVLAAFAGQWPSSFWCDLGAGNGVIAHELARRMPGSAGVAIERQSDLLACARQNLRGLPVTLFEGDLRTFPWKPVCFDLVVCNPPFYGPGEGRLSPVRSIAEARHAIFGDLTAFCEGLWPAIKPGGRMCVILPPNQMKRILPHLAAFGWSVAEELAVQSFPNTEPKRLCLALTTQKPKRFTRRNLILYYSPGEWTPEATRYLQG